MNQTTVEVIINAKNNASREFDKIGEDAKRSSSTVGGAFGSIAGMATKIGLAAGTAGAAFVGFGLKTAGSFEAAEAGFKALLGSSEKAAETMARIKKEAAATPFELEGLTVGAQALTAITKDGNKAVDTLLDVGKAIATSGKGQAELDRVVMNLQQVASTGKVSEMDIRQFQGAIPIFNDIIAAAGTTTEELKNSENGATLLFDAFKKAGQEGGITAEGFTAQAGTFNQLLSNAKDSLTIFGSEFVKQTGLFDTAKHIFETFSNFISENQGLIISIGSALGTAIGGAADAFKRVYDSVGGEVGVKTALEGLKTFIESTLTPALNILGGILGGLTAFMVNHGKEVLIAVGIWKTFQTALAISTAVMTLQKSIEGLTAAQVIANIATKTLGISLAALPLALVITVAIAGVAMILNEISKINAAVDSMSKSVAGAADATSKIKEKYDKASTPEEKAKYKKQYENAAKATSAASKAQSDFTNSFSASILSFSGGRAVGGSVMGNNSYLVGENGPEVFTPALSGKISQPGAGVGGNVTVQINNPVMNNGTDVRMLAEEIERILSRKQELKSIGAI